MSISNSLFAGAWNREKNAGYFQLNFTYLNYGHLLNGRNERIDLKRNITDITYQLYGEYGLSKKWTLILNIPYKIVSSSNKLNETNNDPYANDTLQEGKMSDFSNLSVAFQYNIYHGNYVLAAQLAYQNKMHKYQPESGLRIGYDAHLFSPSILYGKGWSQYYLQIQSGITLNTSNYSQIYFGNLEIGRSLHEGRTYIIFRTDIKLPYTQGHFDEGNSVQTALFRDNSSFISPGIKFMQKIKNKLSFNAAIYGAIYSEREGAQATLNAGISYEW